MVAPLEKAGLVAGAPDPSDGRQTILSLTEKSPTRIRDRTAREDWLIHLIQAKLSPEEREELAHALTLLKRIVDA